MQTVNFKTIDAQGLSGKVWAMPTDTIPGLSCLAIDQVAVNRINVIKNRLPEKAYNILIGSVEQLEFFGIEITESLRKFLRTVWPGPVTVVIEGVSGDFSYLQGNHDGLAFRLPDVSELQELCQRIGPIISTSANMSGESSLKTMKEIVEQFGEQMDYVIKWQFISTGSPSVIVKIIRV